MPKSQTSEKKDKKFDVSLLQWTGEVPLAKRTSIERRAHNKLQRFSKELDKDAWVKAVKLIRGEWTPFPEYHRCFASDKINPHRSDSMHQKLVIEFKNAVLSRNWSNAVKLTKVIFKDYLNFSGRVHLQVFLSVLMSHPKVNEDLFTHACSYIWRLQDKEAIAELMRCFCSMPKKLPSEYLSSDSSRKVLVRPTRDFNSKKSHLSIAYTAHIGISSDNDMFVE